MIWFGQRVVLGIAGLSLLCGCTALSPTQSGAAESSGETRLLGIDDYFAIGEVGEPRISPDGRWIAYTVTTHDLEEDESRTRIWMLPAAGGDAIPLSAEGESSSSPRWSPDGKYLGFLTARDDEGEAGKSQVWSLYREGGEAVQLTDVLQGVEAFEWSPDSKRLLLVV